LITEIVARGVLLGCALVLTMSYIHPFNAGKFLYWAGFSILSTGILIMK